MRRTGHTKDVADWFRIENWTGIEEMQTTIIKLFHDKNYLNNSRPAGHGQNNTTDGLGSM